MAEIAFYTVAPKEGEHPFPPYLHIYLSAYADDPDWGPLMSPNLMTDREIDETIDYLITQLESVREKAKLELKKVKQRKK